MRTRIQKKHLVCSCASDGIRYADGHFYPVLKEKDFTPFRTTKAPSNLRELVKAYCPNGRHSLKLSDLRKEELHSRRPKKDKAGVLTRRVIVTKGSKTTIIANPREAQQACNSIQNIDKLVDSIWDTCGW